MFALTTAGSIVAHLFAFSLWLYNLFVSRPYTAFFRICNFVLTRLPTVSLWFYRLVVLRLPAIFLWVYRYLVARIKAIFRWACVKVRRFYASLKSLRYIWVHYVYILSCILLAFICLVAPGELRTIDAFFFAVSACTETGLNVVDLKDLSTYVQWVLSIFPVVTNVIVISFATLIARLWAFQKKLRRLEHLFLAHIAAEKAPVGHTDDGIELQDRSSRQSSPRRSSSRPSTEQESGGHDHVVWAEGTDNRGSNLDTIRTPSGAALVDGGESGLPDTSRSFVNSRSSQDSARTRRSIRQLARGVVHHGPSAAHILESAFVLGSGPRGMRPPSESGSHETLDDMLALSSLLSMEGRPPGPFSKRELEELGGVEYRSLKLLRWIVIGEVLSLIIFGILGFLIWILTDGPGYRNKLAESGVSPYWWAVYTAETLVTNCGFTLTPDSMAGFRDSPWPMVLSTFLAKAGNTFQPIVLRFTVWVLWCLASRFAARESRFTESLRFLLDHPRKCYTMLFPSSTTWKLFWILVGMTVSDVIFIVAFDLHNEEVRGKLSTAQFINAATFQAASSRHAGTSVFNLAFVVPAVQFSQLVMMYIAVLPVAMSIRLTNEYLERTLGVYRQEPDPDHTQPWGTWLKQHIQQQLGFDLWWICIGTILVCAFESEAIRRADSGVTVFSILFECTSAYANVGLSLGDPSTSTSLSGSLKPQSKVVMCAEMFRGRHRGQPDSLDPTVMLSSARMPER